MEREEKLKVLRQIQSRQLFASFLLLSVCSGEAFPIDFARFSDSKAVGGNDDSEGQRKKWGQLVKEEYSLWTLRRIVLTADSAKTLWRETLKPD